MENNEKCFIDCHQGIIDNGKCDCVKPMSEKYLPYTPENITELAPGETFVFGSNLSGRHGKGAAKTALKWGAEYGRGLGHFGSTYAIPTVNHNISAALPIEEIEIFVDEFYLYVCDHPGLTFLVTEIGCGLAGHSVSAIAPLFKRFLKRNSAGELEYSKENVRLPKKFFDFLINYPL